ncbi:type 4a pilus biogenesis protein PilO [Mucisphaera sp.]|uniref:type 4a pilus biogenesis protein PilO n=1 Tax=Mucisphaera sp. TaxID=2913024 RepID=UPI003D140BAA
MNPQTLKEAWRLLLAAPVLALLFVVAAYLPHRAESHQLNQRLDDATAAEASVTSLEQQVQRATRAVDDLTANYYERSHGLVPDKDPMPEVLGWIGEITRIHNALQPELNTLGENRGDGYRTKRFRLRFSATFHQAFEVLSDIEKLPYLVTAEDIRFTHNGPDEPLDIELTFKTYATHKPAPATQEGSP